MIVVLRYSSQWGAESQGQTTNGLQEVRGGEPMGRRVWGTCPPPPVVDEVEMLVWSRRLPLFLPECFSLFILGRRMTCWGMEVVCSGRFMSPSFSGAWNGGEGRRKGVQGGCGVMLLIYPFIIAQRPQWLVIAVIFARGSRELRLVPCNGLIREKQGCAGRMCCYHANLPFYPCFYTPSDYFFPFMCTRESVVVISLRLISRSGLIREKKGCPGRMCCYHAYLSYYPCFNTPSAYSFPL